MPRLESGTSEMQRVTVTILNEIPKRYADHLKTEEVCFLFQNDCLIQTQTYKTKFYNLVNQLTV